MVKSVKSVAVLCSAWCSLSDRLKDGTTLLHMASEQGMSLAATLC